MTNQAPVKPGPTGELGEDARKFVAAPTREPKTTQNKFLFINESATPKAGKKLGHRSECVDSHCLKFLLFYTLVRELLVPKGHDLKRPV